MQLSLIEQFALIALNDEKGRFESDTTYLNNGLAGATLLELGLQNRIDWSKENLRVVDDTPLEDPILNQALQAIKSDKPASISHWIGVLNANSSGLKSATLKKLQDKGIIEKHEGKTLWIFSYNTYPTKNEQPENKIRERLHDIIVGARNPEPVDAMLLGLIDVCQLRKEAFRTKDERKRAKEWYKKNEGSEVTKAIDSTMQELQAAIMAATLTAVIASTTAAT
jgi:hypothetical protein